MYKILIVDDEKWVRKGMISKLNYLGFTFAWVGEAENGQEAFDLIKEVSPHIVVTDVRMPVMEGIQLIKKVQEADIRSRFIIISGYAEFEYAEQALNLGVDGYVLKPVSEEALNDTMKKVIEKLDNENTFIKVKEKNISLEKNNENLIFEREVNRIFHGSEKDAEGKTDIEKGQFKFDENCRYMLILMNIDSSNYLNTSFTYQDLDLIKFAIKNIIGERKGNNNILVMDNFRDISQIMILFLGPSEEDIRKKCDLFIYDVYSLINKFMRISVTVAISGIEDKITRELYMQAKTAMDMRLTNGANKIYKYDSNKLNEKINLPEHKLRLFQKYIEMRDFQNVHVILNDIFSADNLNSASRRYIRVIYFEVIRIVMKNCSSLDANINNLMDSDFISGEILDRFDSLSQIVSYIYTTIVDVFKGNEAIISNCKDIVGMAKDYILKNYDEEITVKDLACKFAISPNYFSTVFKQETGETVTKFLMDSRLEKACQLLKGTQATISEISQIVGYQDSQYFYRVFKKAIGKTPLEYRNDE